MSSMNKLLLRGVRTNIRTPLIFWHLFVKQSTRRDPKIYLVQNKGALEAIFLAICTALDPEFGRRVATQLEIS